MKWPADDLAFEARSRVLKFSWAEIPRIKGRGDTMKFFLRLPNHKHRVSWGSLCNAKQNSPGSSEKPGLLGLRSNRARLY